jgi:anti-sigma B factor antagonist
MRKETRRMPDLNLRPNGDLLTVQVEGDGHAVVLRASGELDPSTTGTLDAALRRAMEGNASKVVLDLDGLDFIDSGGLRLLVAAAERSRDNGNRLHMRGGSHAVKRVLAITGLDHSLPFVD